MLRTPLTELLGVTRPLVGAPMAGVSTGRLARAVTEAGGLGMIAAGSTTPAGFVTTESAVASDDGRLPFGVGLMAWALPDRPDLLDVVTAAKPALVSVSFGDPAPYVAQLREAGAMVASQVQDVASARVAVDAGVDLVVAQGTEAGGHTGRVGTLPLLQLVLDVVDVPVVAAGGIATARGVAAALAAGACGVWVGTALIAAPESAHSDAARARIVAADETQTVHTYAFDRTLGIPWPPAFPGRALTNEFTRRWHGHEDALDDEARQALRSARTADDYDVAYIYAGQAVGAVRAARPAGEVVRDLVDGAERLLRERCARLV